MADLSHEIMKTFNESLLAGFKSMEDYWSFKFGDNNEYELCFEPLIYDHQYYVALYKNKELLTEKVVVQPGF